MKWFSFDWLRSPERKELEQEMLKGQQLQNELLQKEVDSTGNPYKKLLYIGNSLSVIFWTGVTITRNVEEEVFLKVKGSTSEGQILDLLMPKVEVTDSDTQEEIELVTKASTILHTHPDFSLLNNNLMLKGVDLAIPPVVLASFIELVEKMSISKDDTFTEKFEALKMFWRWLALNPIESSRNDALTFIKKNNISITSNGLLELYRRVVSVGSKDKELVNFVSEQYFKVKKWKKSPKNYYINEYEPNVFKVTEGIVTGYTKFHGNLEDLYKNIALLKENTYTDNHTKSKVIRVGTIYREDEDKIDLDNTIACSRGLHAGDRSFGFSGFGDTGVMVLVNPSKIRSVPTSATNKIRVSEMFIVGVVSLEDYSAHVDSGDLTDYSEEYFSQSVKELEEELSTKNVQGHKVVVDIQSIKNALKSRVVKI